MKNNQTPCFSFVCVFRLIKINCLFNCFWSIIIMQIMIMVNEDDNGYDDDDFQVQFKFQLFFCFFFSCFLNARNQISNYSLSSHSLFNVINSIVNNDQDEDEDEEVKRMMMKKRKVHRMKHYLWTLKGKQKMKMEDYSFLSLSLKVYSDADSR